MGLKTNTYLDKIRQLPVIQTGFETHLLKSTIPIIIHTSQESPVQQISKVILLLSKLRSPHIHLPNDDDDNLANPLYELRLLAHSLYYNLSL